VTGAPVTAGRPSPCITHLRSERDGRAGGPPRSPFWARPRAGPRPRSPAPTATPYEARMSTMDIYALDATPRPPRRDGDDGRGVGTTAARGRSRPDGSPTSTGPSSRRRSRRSPTISMACCRSTTSRRVLDSPVESVGFSRICAGSEGLSSAARFCCSLPGMWSAATPPGDPCVADVFNVVTIRSAQPATRATAHCTRRGGQPAHLHEKAWRWWTRS
jgi:hypothetical protein